METFPVPLQGSKTRLPPGYPRLKPGAIFLVPLQGERPRISKPRSALQAALAEGVNNSLAVSVNVQSRGREPAGARIYIRASVVVGRCPISLTTQPDDSSYASGESVCEHALHLAPDVFGLRQDFAFERGVVGHPGVECPDPAHRRVEPVE